MVAFAAQTLGLEGAIKLKNETGSQSGHAHLVGRLQHEAQIFLLQINGKARPPIPLGHLRATVAECPTTRRATGNGRQRFL